MNQDLSAGLGAGLMNLGNMFSQMLMRRMDAEWEDEQYEKRLAAAQKAEIEKLKALDDYKAKQVAGFAPVVQPGPDGNPQYLQQPINSIGAPIGDTQPMPAHARAAYDLAEKARKQKTMLDNLTLQGKLKDIESEDVRMDKDRAQAELARKRASGAIGGPRSKEKDYFKDAKEAKKELLSLKAELPDELRKQLDKEIAEVAPQGAPVTDQQRYISYTDLLEEYQSLWQETAEFKALRDAKRKKILGPKEY